MPVTRVFDGEPLESSTAHLETIASTGVMDARAGRFSSLSRPHSHGPGGHMDLGSQYVVQSFGRVQKYLDAHVAVLGAINTTEARTTLDDVVTRLDGHRLTRDAARIQTVGETNRQRQLESELREKHMRPVATFAKAKLRGVPDFKAMTTVRKLKGLRLVAAAQAMAQAAAPFAAQFAAADFPSTFLDELSAAAEAVKASMETRSRTHVVRVGSGKALKAELKRGRDAVGELSGAVLKKLAGNTQLLAEWHVAKRVVRKPGVPATPATAKVPTPAPTGPAPVNSTPASAPAEVPKLA